MKQAIIFLLCALMLTGCKSKQTTIKENIKLDVAEKVDRTEKQTESLNKIDNVVKDVKTNVSDKTITRTTETEFSAPDASGKQHKTKEKTTETRNDVQTINEANERIISEQNKEIKRLTASNSELRTMLNASLSEKTKTITKLPFWIYIVSFAIGAVSALLLRTWIKTKFNR